MCVSVVGVRVYERVCEKCIDNIVVFERGRERERVREYVCVFM